MLDVLPQSSELRAPVSLFAPVAWLRSQFLSPDYWRFFLVALFFDAGFAIYFFLFNLYLLDGHATERTIGVINGAFTLGSTLGTLPAGALGHKLGVKPLLLLCVIAAPLVGLARLLTLPLSLQIALAFAAGMAMCLWGVAYLPSVASLTNENNRALAYSLIFCASIISSALGGGITTYLSAWLPHAAAYASHLRLHRSILIASCIVALMAVWPAVTVRLSLAAETQTGDVLRGFRPTPFLLRSIPFVAVWTAIMGAFLPFANVFLVKQGIVTVERVGLVFAVGQCLQLFLGLLTPAVLRLFGLLRGILVIQLGATASLLGVAFTRKPAVVITLYLLYAALNWMCSPALYNLLMSRTDEEQRSHAAAMVLFLNALLTSATVTAAGTNFTFFGFNRPIAVIALAGAITAIALFRSLTSFEHPHP